MNQETEIRSPVTVLVVDDSAFMRNALSQMINSDPELKVVATAGDGMEALTRITELNPDVVTLDVEMPGLNGLETLRHIMAQSARPVIMVSSVENAQITFTALGAGAFDYVPKHLSRTTLDIDHIRADLVAKVKAAAEWVHRRRQPKAARKPPSSVIPFEPQSSVAPAIVAVGASTGGPAALQQILPCLPADLSVPILIVQHMPEGFTATFAQRLNALCAISVQEATDHETLKRGTVYIAPAGAHMKVQRSPTNCNVTICLTQEPKDHLHIPSIDILMESVAAEFGNLAMGIIMTGMGSDGAMGMKAIHRQGGFTVGQDEASCAVYSMPRACAEAGILRRIVPLSRIPEQILQAIQYRKRA